MKKKNIILLHVPVWIVALGVILAKGILSPDAFSDPIFESIQLTIVISWTLGTFYLFYLYLVPRFLQKKDIILFSLLSVVAACIIPLLSHYAVLFNKIIFNHPHNYSITLHGWLVSFFVTTFIGGLGSFYRFATDWFFNLGVKEKMENLQLKTEINLLKSKLNPHFLFNTLNNIDTLIDTDSKNASVFLGKLSSILRYVVYDSENEKVDCSKEISCIQDYIELQTLRLNEKDSVLLNISGNYNGYKIAPVLVLPFIENIFKHGIFNSGDKSQIIINFENGILQFDTKNPFKKSLKNSLPNNGIGIETTRKRLELLYPRLHSLNIEERNNIFHVALQIDLNDH